MDRHDIWTVHMDVIFGHDDCSLEQVETCVYIFIHYVLCLLGFYETCLNLMDLCLLSRSIDHRQILSLLYVYKIV